MAKTRIEKRYFLTVMALVVVQLAVFSPSQALAADLSSYDWSVNAARNLATNPPPKSVVRSFMDDMIHFGWKVPLCEFRFANLRQSGFLSLVASMDDSQRGFCNRIFIVDQTRFGFKLYLVEGVGRLTGFRVEDVAGDGHYEIIIWASFTNEVTGARQCAAQWPAIFAWTGKGYQNVSTRYPEYYRRKLASLQEQIATADRERAEIELEQERAAHPTPTPMYEGSVPGYVIPTATPSPTPTPTPIPEAQEPPYDGEDCDMAEAAKIERFLGISRDAGFADAVKWSESERPATRIFAANVLQDIGTPEAIGLLQSLANDSNSSVAQEAKYDLQYLRKVKIDPHYNPGVRIREVKPTAR